MADKLPSNLELENYIICCSINDPDSAKYVVNELGVEDFTDTKFSLIFRALKTIYERKEPLELINIINAVKEIDTAGLVTADYLNGIVDNFYYDTESLEKNAGLLRDKTIARDVYAKMKNIISSYDSNKFRSDEEFIASTESEISLIARNKKVGGFANMKNVGLRVASEMEKMKENNSDLIGLSTGFKSLDKLISGLQKGRTIILAARTGLGKSALGINICYNVAEKYKKPVLIFSLEMRPEEVGNRILAAASNVDGRKIATGRLDDDEQLKFNKGLRETATLPIYIDEDSGINSRLGNIVNKCYKFKAEHDDLALILIDYIGLITTGEKVDKRIEIGNISHRLKQLANELDCPILVVSQIKRTQNKYPEVSDLKESGDIEQDADQVIMLYREDYDGTNQRKDENPNTRTERMKGQKDSGSSMVEAYVRKNRNGETGISYLLFFKQTQKFATPTDEATEEYKAGMSS